MTQGRVERVSDQDARRTHDAEPAITRIASEEAAARGGKDRRVRDPRIADHYDTSPGGR